MADLGPCLGDVVRVLHPLRGAPDDLVLLPAQRARPGRVDRQPDASVVGDPQHVAAELPDAVALGGLRRDLALQVRVQVAQLVLGGAPGDLDLGAVHDAPGEQDLFLGPGVRLGLVQTENDRQSPTVEERQVHERPDPDRSEVRRLAYGPGSLATSSITTSSPRRSASM